MKISGNPACTCEKKIFFGWFFLRPPPDLKKKILEKTLERGKKKRKANRPTETTLNVATKLNEHMVF